MYTDCIEYIISDEERNQEEALLQTDVEPIPQEMLRKYIMFARTRVLILQYLFRLITYSVFGNVSHVF